LFEEKYGDDETQRTLERATLKHSKANKNKKLQFMTQADKKGGEKARTNVAAKVSSIAIDKGFSLSLKYLIAFILEHRRFNGSKTSRTFGQKNCIIE
jgi:hypothetical protein